MAKIECHVHVEVSEVTTEREAIETATNLAGVKLRLGGIRENYAKISDVEQYKNGEGKVRWRAKAMARGEKE